MLLQPIQLFIFNYIIEKCSPDRPLKKDKCNFHVAGDKGWPLVTALGTSGGGRLYEGWEGVLRAERRASAKMLPRGHQLTG